MVSSWSFVFYVSWVVGKLPRRFCKGWMEYATPALQVVIVPYLLGSTRELGTVWIVLSGSRCGILGFALASIVTLERCRRSCGGALSRNLHRGSINLWCPADSDRPTDGWAVSLAIFPECELVLMLLGEYLPNAPSLSLGGRLSTSYPLWVVSRWATTKCFMRLATIQQWVGCESTLRPT